MPYAEAVVATDNALSDLLADAEFIQQARHEAVSGEENPEKPCEHLSRVAILKCKINFERGIHVRALFTLRWGGEMSPRAASIPLVLTCAAHDADGALAAAAKTQKKAS